MNTSHKKISALLEEIVESCVEDETITVEEFLSKMGNRAQAMAILVFSISAVVAGIVPGFSTLVGVPIMLIAGQIAIGRRSIWLPEKIRSKPIPPKVVRGALAQSIPSLRKMEKFLRPRMFIFSHPYVIRLIAILIVVLGGVLSLPIPGGNFLPSFGISILSLAILERDGLFVLVAVGLVVLTGGVMIDLITQAFSIVVNTIHWII